MSHTATPLSLAPILVAALACAPQAGPGADETGAGETGDASDRAIARGISITQVEANQGVAIPLSEGPDWIDGAGRNARLIAGRPTLVRVHYAVEPGWVPREIAATLVLDGADETRVELEQIREVSGDSWPGDFDDVFFFELHPELGHTDPGMQFQVALHETSGESIGDSEGAPRSPSEGLAPIGFEGPALVPELVLVPIINPEVGGPPDVPYEELESLLFAWLPASDLELELHEPVAPGGEVNDNTVLTFIKDLREHEQPAPNVSYIAILEEPVEGDFGQSTAWSAGSVEVEASEASRRYGMVIWRSDVVRTSQSIAHVMYMHHGVERVRCPGEGLGDEDPLYPHAQGKIGVWGFNIATGQLYNPNLFFDLASWCEPAWVSDYSWRRFADGLATMSSW